MAELPVTIKDNTALGGRKAKRTIDDIRNSARRTSGAVGGLNKSIGSMGGMTGKVAGTLSGPVGITASLAAFSLAARSAMQDALKFSTAIAELSTLLPVASRDVERMASAASDLAVQFGSDPTEQVKSFYQIVSAGASDAAEATDILTTANKLAIGGVTDVTTAADGLTSTLNAYGLAGTEATSVSDAFFVAMRAGKTTIGELANSIGDVAPLAAQTGVSFEELLASTAALTKGGQSTSVAMRGVRAILATIVKPSKEAADLAASLGLKFNAAALKARGLQGILKDVQDATGGSAEQMGLLFGGVEALVPAMALTGKASEDLQAILANMDTRAGQTEEALNKMMSTPQKKLDRLMANMKVASTELGGVLLGIFVPVIDVLNQVLEKETSVVDEILKAGQRGKTARERREKEEEAILAVSSQALLGSLPVQHRGRVQAVPEVEEMLRARLRRGELARQERLTQLFEQGRGGSQPGADAERFAMEQQAHLEQQAQREAERRANARHPTRPRITAEDGFHHAGNFRWIHDQETSPLVPDRPSIDLSVDLEGLATPWIEGLKSVNERMADLTIEREWERLDFMRSTGADQAALLQQQGLVERLQLDRTLGKERDRLEQLGVTDKEIASLIKAETNLVKARGENRKTVKDLTDKEKELDQKEKDAIKKYQEMLRLGQGLVLTLGRINTKVGYFGQAILDVEDILSTFQSSADLKTGEKDTLGLVVSSVLLAVDLFGDALFGAGESASDAARRLRELEDQIDRSVTGNVASAFSQDPSFIRARAEVVQPFIDLFRNQTMGLEDDDPQRFLRFRSLLDRFALETVESLSMIPERGVHPENVLRTLAESQFGTLADFQEALTNIFGSTGKIPDIMSSMFDFSDAAASLGETLETSAKAATRLTSAEEDVIRLRFRGELIGAQADFGQAAKNAGSDVFLRRKAFLEFQKAVDAIRESTRLAVSRGVEDSTTTPSGAAKEAASTTDVSGDVSLEVDEVTVDLSDKAALVPDDLLILPTVGDFSAYFDTIPPIVLLALNATTQRFNTLPLTRRYISFDRLATLPNLSDVEAFVGGLDAHLKNALNLEIGTFKSIPLSAESIPFDRLAILPNKTDADAFVSGLNTLLANALHIEINAITLTPRTIGAGDIVTLEMHPQAITTDNVFILNNELEAIKDGSTSEYPHRINVSEDLFPITIASREITRANVFTLDTELGDFKAGSTDQYPHPIDVSKDLFPVSVAPRDLVVASVYTLSSDLFALINGNADADVIDAQNIVRVDLNSIPITTDDIWIVDKGVDIYIEGPSAADIIDSQNIVRVDVNPFPLKPSHVFTKSGELKDVMADHSDQYPFDIPILNIFDVNTDARRFLYTGDVIDPASHPVRRAVGTHTSPWYTIPVRSLFDVGNDPIFLSTFNVVRLPTQEGIQQDLSIFVANFHTATAQAFVDGESNRIPLNQVIDFESPEVVTDLITALMDGLRDQPDFPWMIRP